VSSNESKTYQHLAILLANAFDDGSDSAIAKQLAKLPKPGSHWPTNPPPQFPMPWATHWGQDEFGLWCSFTIVNIVQRMRWIPPWEFLMGSTPEEPERDNDEIQHRVIISQGYWLADTACSQALWEAVMESNPSHFKGNDLPVESISWEDVEEFNRKLNEKISGLKARLPSEAEWEYACRAGTETPFWWGEELTTDLANYNSNNPYNNGPKGVGREKTMPIKSFAANPWGLYQTHGNVWEWCEDWFGVFPEVEGCIDPIGPDDGTYRVLRGGSWFGLGEWLRAAFRNHFSPVNRYGDLGFRLAAGPRPGGAKE